MSYIDGVDVWVESPATPRRKTSPNFPPSVRYVGVHVGIFKQSP